MPRADPVLIFDLDGTILQGNSFPRWVLALLSGASAEAGLHARLATSLRVQSLLLRRKLGRLRHADLVRALQPLWATAGGPAAARLQSALLRQVRGNLRPLLRCVADCSADALLATAAAADYAEPLGRELGFLHILATPRQLGALEPCNSGEHKRDRVLEKLTTLGWTDRPRIFFNDHLDDLSLMKVSQTVCWFGGRRALDAARRAATGTRFVACRGMSTDELCQTLAHVRQSLETVQLARTVSFAWSPRARTFS